MVSFFRVFGFYHLQQVKKSTDRKIDISKHRNIEISKNCERTFIIIFYKVFFSETQLAAQMWSRWVGRFMWDRAATISEGMGMDGRKGGEERPFSLACWTQSWEKKAYPSSRSCFTYILSCVETHYFRYSLHRTRFALACSISLFCLATMHRTRPRKSNTYFIINMSSYF